MNRRVLALILTLLAAMAVPLWAWHRLTGDLLVALAFWSAVVGMNIAFTLASRNILDVLGRGAMMVGALLNATVTIANGGRMPVAGATDIYRGAWVAATDQHRLLWLADQEPWWLRASMGDVVLTIGLVLAVAGVAREFCRARHDRLGERREELRGAGDDWPSWKWTSSPGRTAPPAPGSAHNAPLAPGRAVCQDGRTMTQTEDFIGTLHVIAASDDPLDRQKEAVREVLARYLMDARQSLAGDQRVRRWIIDLDLELTRLSLLPRADRFADLRDHARTLAADWLREHPE